MFIPPRESDTRIAISGGCQTPCGTGGKSGFSAVVTALTTDSAYVDYYVLGSFTTPYFLKDKDGIATPDYPADDDESFDVDTKGADATRGPSTVSFMASTSTPS